MFASKDRIDLSSFLNSRPLQVNVTPNDILPSSSDLTVIKSTLKFLSQGLCFCFYSYYKAHVFAYHRVLVQRLEEFLSQKKAIQWHLPNAYSKEMSS